MDFSIIICWTSPFVILGVLGLFYRFNFILDENPVSDSVDSDQTPHYVASDLGLHCLPMTLLQVSRYEKIQVSIITITNIPFKPLIQILIQLT